MVERKLSQGLRCKACDAPLDGMDAELCIVCYESIVDILPDERDKDEVMIEYWEDEEDETLH